MLVFFIIPVGNIFVSSGILFWIWILFLWWTFCKDWEIFLIFTIPSNTIRRVKWCTSIEMRINVLDVNITLRPSEHLFRNLNCFSSHLHQFELLHLTESSLNFYRCLVIDPCFWSSNFLVTFPVWYSATIYLLQSRSTSLLVKNARLEFGANITLLQSIWNVSICAIICVFFLLGGWTRSRVWRRLLGDIWRFSLRSWTTCSNSCLSRLVSCLTSSTWSFSSSSSCDIWLLLGGCLLLINHSTVSWNISTCTGVFLCLFHSKL